MKDDVTEQERRQEERVIEIRIKKGRKLSFYLIVEFSPQMVTVAMDRPGHNQKPRVHSGVLCW